MTHEADNTNFALSLMDDAAEAAFCASVSRAKLSSDQFEGGSGKSNQQARMSFGRWSIQDKLEWECQACTFLNQPLFLSCEMCGQARPAQQGTNEVAIPAEARGVTEDILPADVQREFLIEEEERMLKQERIKEIMALQQGIFNKIREENEEEELNDLEGSFAWMELDDSLPTKDLPPATSRVSYVKESGLGKKPPPMDASSSTVTTAGMSSFSGSSRFSLDWSGNSQHSRLSTSHRNSSIPDQALASLKEESAQGSYVRGSLGMGSAHGQPMPSVQQGQVDFSTLKAAVEGVSVHSFGMEDGSGHSVPVGLQGDSTHSARASFGLNGACTHSPAREPEALKHTRRRGALRTPALSSDGQQALRHNEENEAGSRVSQVGAMQMTGVPTEKSEDDERQDRRSLSDLPALAPIGAMPCSGAPAAKSHKESHNDRLFGEGGTESPKSESPTSELGQAPRDLFTGMTRTPQSRPDDHGRGDLRGSLHRRTGALKIPSPSLVPPEKRHTLTSPRDPVFSRNLYSDRKNDAANKKNSRSVSPKNKKEKSHSISIPLFNRMLRKKNSTRPTETN